MKKCPECKTLNDDGALYCSFCGYPLVEDEAGAIPATPQNTPTGTPPAPEAPAEGGGGGRAGGPTPPPASEPAASPQTKSVAAAVIASILFPGLGQTYNGYLLKGVLFYLGITLFSLPGYPSILVAGAVYLYAIYDAYRASTRMNKGECAFRNHSWASIFLYFVSAVAISIAGAMILTLMMTAAEEYYLYTDSCGSIFGCS